MTNAFAVLLTACFIVFDLVVATAVVLFGPHFYCKAELKGKLDDELKKLRKKKD